MGHGPDPPGTDGTSLDALDLPPFELTPLGEDQCFLLGRSIRSRYVGESNGTLHPDRLFGTPFLSRYDPRHHFFFSTNTSRTVRSILSVSNGLFERQLETTETESEESSPSAGLGPTHQSVYINVHDTRYSREYDLCPSAQNISKFVWEQLSEEELTQTNLKRMSELLLLGLGSQLNSILSFYHRIDTLKVYAAHGGLVSITEESMNELLEFLDKVWWRRYRFTSNLDIEKSVGTKWVEMTKQRMVDAKFAQKGSYYHVAGHDSGVSVILAALGITGYVAPGYGAAVALELLKSEEDGKFGVRAVFKKNYAAEWEVLRLASVGTACEENDVCPFDDFAAFVRKMDILNDHDWCLVCDPYGQYPLCELHKSEREKLKVSSDYTSALVEIDDLKSKIGSQTECAETQQELDSALRELTKKDMRIANLTRLAEDIRDECAGNLRESLKETEKKLEDMTSNRNTLQDEVSILHTQLKKAEDDIEDLRNELDSEIDDCVFCKGRLMNATATISQLLLRPYDAGVPKFVVFFLIALWLITLVCLVALLLCFYRLRKRHQTVVDYQRVRIELSSSDEDFDEVDLLANM